MGRGTPCRESLPGPFQPKPGPPETPEIGGKTAELHENGDYE